MHQNRRLCSILPAALLLAAGSGALQAQVAEHGRAPLIHGRVDETRLAALKGNTRPEANAANDLGAVADSLAVPHMLLQLKRSPEQERAVEAFIDDLHNPASPNFHKWISAAEFGTRFGAADSDIQTITQWLESNGFTVNTIYPSRMVIDFSGTAGEIRAAFHTTIHNLDVDGVHHLANANDPRIPAALAPAVAGVMSLHDFRPRKMARAKYTYSFGGQETEAVVPADLATIYNFPAFSKGIDGSGQTIVVIEDTDLFNPADWTTFRSAFGLSQFTNGSLTTMYPAPPSGPNNCEDPGVNSDDIEAELDVEWATAAAPGASIVAAVCADSTSFTSGLVMAIQNVVNSSTPPPIMSISYGVCEAMNGAALNASLNSIYQQAVAEGISVFVASGDEGAAACDAGQLIATHGIGVSGFASTPYNVAVGGTDFSDTFNSTVNTYWSKSNSTTYGSALSYIPEIPWNDSCASILTANYMGFSSAYGPNGFCASSTASSGGFLAVAGGSGGPSNCATGAPTVSGVASGTCAGYAKPSWQAGVSGIAADGVRDIPDVSLFSSNGAWGHYLVFCFSDIFNGGAPCRGAPSRWAGAGGTSFASPVMAGVQALIDQSMGGPQGNPNVVYYKLAATTPSVFHPVTQGDIDVNCGGSADCFGYVGNLDFGRNGRIFGTTYGGALSVSTTTFESAYAAGGAWNFANGLGSVDVSALVTNWIKQ